ncbi:MAG TPA: tRNA (N6-threonylcarbamoyladenosine(37)-N6)-methyltransferase TrmO [Sulfolobales archaeon]|nr:tRNA (N6-threonylcarbamoyladenosine(37)-N6)-methyltransferase TrmO [Sulfolobales archaeon]
MLLKFTLKPIGFVRVSLSDDAVRESIRGVSGIIEILPEYEEALDGIDGFSHLIVIAYLHKIVFSDRRLKVKPKRLIKLGLSEEEVPMVGVFCTDSPYRPNPIAVSIVRLLRREGRILYVDNLDLFDGTPILDIKPYTFSRRVDKIEVPSWYLSLINKVRSIRPDIVEI